ncbi:collagen alpha-1(VII) chain-like [Procambarus clarkii]|uniref:collagen alpha-1(VII) chain-like n=1 Tax=Procambarus clarkii TaxID=6728 RepID=UPI003743348D
MALPMPPIRRVDTVELAFSGQVNYSLLEVALLDVLGVNPADVCGVQLAGEHRALVKLTDAVVYRDMVDKYDGRTVPLPGAAGTVTVTDLCVPVTFVVVRGLPFEFPESLLRRFLGGYGSVLACRANVLKSGRLRGVLMGIRTVTMKLRKAIPSSMVLLGFKVQCFYAGQERTCFRCGMAGHLAAGCRNGTVRLVNVFREEDFPPLHGLVDLGDAPAGLNPPPAPTGDGVVGAVCPTGADVSGPMSVDPPGVGGSAVVTHVEVHPPPVAIAVDVGASVGRGPVLSPVEDVAPDSGARGVEPLEADEFLEGGRPSRRPSTTAVQGQPGSLTKRRKTNRSGRSGDRGPSVRRLEPDASVGDGGGVTVSVVDPSVPGGGGCVVDPPGDLVCGSPGVRGPEWAVVDPGDCGSADRGLVVKLRKDSSLPPPVGSASPSPGNPVAAATASVRGVSAGPV